MADMQVDQAPGRRWHTLRQISPAAVFYCIFFVVPLLILFFISFWRMRNFNLVADFTLSNYRESLTSNLYRAVLFRTIVIGFLATYIVVPIAYVFSYLMRFVFERRAQMLLDLVLVSMFSGYLVRIYAWRTILGKDGILNSLLLEMRVIDAPLRYLIFSNWAVIIILVGLLLPLAILPIYSSMSNISKEYIEVAKDLGSRGVHLHRTIIIPMILPGLRIAFAFTFLLAVGEFVVPALVGGTQGLMIGNVIADQFRGIGSNWPLGAALAFVVIGVVMAVYLMIIRIIGAATKF
jgi:spermidine/putrescine transport system permease protein